MDTFLWVGTCLGAIFGLIHAVKVYQERLADGVGGPGKAIYFALWTVALWTLFGAYLLAFWIIGGIGLAFARLRRLAEPGP